MKKLEELGISPTPWKIVPYGESTNSKVATHGDVEFANGESAFTKDGVDNLQKIADACLMVAAPDMYEALLGLLEIVCDDCKCPYEIEGKCVKCPRVVAAEKALAKAAGEEVAK